MPKQILYGDDARRQVLEGVSMLARSVGSTLGPAGRLVIMEKPAAAPVATKDGVTVGKEVELPGIFGNMGVRLVREAAQKTSEQAGDGTTTATVLAEAILREGMRRISGGANPVEVQRGIEKGVSAAVADLAARARPVRGKDEVARVAAVAANHDAEIGRFLSDAFERVGKDGAITVESGTSIETTLEYVEGLQFDKGYVSPYFVTDVKRMEAVLEDPWILFFEKKISSARDMIFLLERVAQTGRPIVLIAEEIEGEALALLVVNKIRGVLASVAVKAPGFGDRRRSMLEDMAILTGGRLVSEDTGLKLERLGTEVLGRAKKVIVSKETTTIVGGAGEAKDVQARISQMERQVRETTSEYDREKLQERVQKLKGGVAIIRIGAATEPAMNERKARLDDALRATRAALEEGIVPGGGVALLRAIPAVRRSASELSGDERVGAEVLAKALEHPLFLIAANAGQDGDVVVGRVLETKGNVGYEAIGGTIVDLVEAGVIDPLKVVRVALENAASVAGTLLTADAFVADLPGKKPAATGAVA